MWKPLLFFAFLSVDAQRLKLNHNVRDGTEIFDLNAVQAQQAFVSYRLPNETVPELYLINLSFGDFHEGDLSFSGNVMISIRVLENTDTITLHSSGLLVVNTVLTTSVNVEISHTIDFNTERELLILKTSETLVKDSMVRLTINYRGTIRSSITGVYRGSYLHNGDETRYVQYVQFVKRKCNYFSCFRYFLATHMQPTFFRRVCPSYDEPRFKAFFSLVLSYNQVFRSISNMAQEFSFIE